MEFKIENINNDCGWFIGAIDYPFGYLWHDLTVHSRDTGGKGGSGYYATKAEAERYLRAYEVSQMEFTVIQYCLGWVIFEKNSQRFLWKDLELHQPFTGDGLWDGYYHSEEFAKSHLHYFKEKYSVPQTTEIKDMKFIVRQCRHWPERGWYIITDTGAKYHGERFVWCDLELHEGTGYGDFYPGTAPGYYCTQTQAEIVLRQFKEKHSMTENTIKINVEINGETKPLCDLSEETLLRIRKASKPKPVPVFQVVDWCKGEPRLVLKVTDEIREEIKDNDFIALNEDGNIVHQGSIESVDLYYNDRRELRLDEV